MTLTWFFHRNGRDNFVGERYLSFYPHGTARECVEQIQKKHEAIVGLCSKILATDGPERAEKAAEADFWHYHKDGRTCPSCTHTAEIGLGEALPEADNPPGFWYRVGRRLGLVA
jgi:hypothetical protein